MKGSSLQAMAWRNIWRHRRRTLLTLSSIAFGTMAAILFTGIGDSNWREMIDLAARLGGGHVSLQHPEFQDTPTFTKPLQAVGELRALALRDPDVDRVVERIAGSVMLVSAAQSRGAGFIAFDPAQEDASTLSVLDALSDGELLQPGQERGIVLGSRLAHNLGTTLGRKIVYTLTDRNGDIVQEAVRIRGLITTGSASVDGGLVLLPLAAMRGALGFAEDEATQVSVFLRDQRRAEVVAERLGAALGDDVAALTWHETQPDLSAFIAMKVAGAQVMEALIMILVAAGIFNTLFVSVMERVREFGVMLAIGFSPGRLFGLVMFESLWLGLSGLVLAAIVTAGPYYYLNRVGFDLSSQIPIDGSEIAGVAVSSFMRAEIYPENLMLITGFALLATLLSGLYPAWNAGRIAPVESIRTA